MALKFGLLWPFRNPEFSRQPWPAFYRDHLDLCVESEALGYDHIWLSEHHFVEDGYSPSVLPIAAALAARTSRIRIGTNLLLLPMHNPLRVAEDTATIDQIANGRFDLGVGLGYRPCEFTAQGLSLSERGARLTEGVQLVQRLLSGETVTFAGRFNQLHEVRVSPPACQQPHPPIWLGALAQQAIDRAARLGFHFQSVGPGGMDKVYDAALEKYGRRPSDYHIGQAAVVYVAPSRTQAWETAARPLHYMTSQYVRWFLEAGDMPGAEAAQAALIDIDEMLRRQSFDFLGQPALIGTPNDVAAMIDDLKARSRITHFCCVTPSAGMAVADIRAHMRLFAAQVMPRFMQ